ncbi:hypothetical protein [Persicirhabdus sediminis]|uniref:Uncharacterized protein n=1 Tax=Persicirhabdus sediminis TaxID=454144 RepID=A0A8J7SQ28_9BACT|nr:hypothetical protein [Persicirhabdus sediminis]MBK1792723.1 hypothetical protein [Persicirhabdus sediminis]
MDLQEFLAIAVVIITISIFAYRILRPKKKNNCGHGCGCDAQKLVPKQPHQDAIKQLKGKK